MYFLHYCHTRIGWYPFTIRFIKLLYLITVIIRCKTQHYGKIYAQLGKKFKCVAVKLLGTKNDVSIMSEVDLIEFKGTNTNQKKILDYLVRGMGEGKQYFKSKYIARDLGLSPKEVGTNLKILSDVCTNLKIEKWSYSKSTTWRVEPC